MHASTHVCIYSCATDICSFRKYSDTQIALNQALQSKLKSAITEANNALIPSDSSNRINAADLQNAAAKLTETTALIVSAGLQESDPLVQNANKSGETFRDMSAKVRPEHAL